MKDLGRLHHFLGTSVERLAQKQYTLDIIQQTGMVDCKPCSTLLTLTPSYLRLMELWS
jgi:hypothetical protein